MKTLVPLYWVHLTPCLRDIQLLLGLVLVSEDAEESTNSFFPSNEICRGGDDPF
jgi:hypothetical protein